MANNRIGCSVGKTSLIDPNNFSGQGSFDNISVPLEDLTISVQLETIKKGRTILSSNNIKNKETKTTENSRNVRVTFIEGTVIGGQKVLSSKFTDLTTVFDKDNDSSENLGITNIDIDFNSSYAPLITINFLDLRGSSIFQNEAQLNNNENKYSVFFQLPYPLYELTIKGYYGKPVKYCLHMTKFNSKFNSQTGNFEITGNFVGYTYAMLSDMLLGILKAIPYTTRGGKKYKDLKSENPSLLNLNELMIKIGEIDKNLEKIGSNDPDAAKVSWIDSMLSEIAIMKVNINNLGTKIDYKTDLIGEEAYSHIAIQNFKPEPLTEYDAVITESINNYNEYENKGLFGVGISLSNFLAANRVNGNANTATDNILVLTNQTFDNPNSFTDAVGDRKDSIEATTTLFNGYDMSSLFTQLNDRRLKLQLKKKEYQLKLGETIKNSITKSLSFSPTIRNIVNTFTVAVEVYLSVMFDVSNEAEDNGARRNELKTAFNQNGNSDLKSEVKYFPWPDYREDRSNEGYVEKYLGAPGVLKNALLVHELVFIDDLYNGFLKAKAASDIAALQLTLLETTWVPVNPFDTKIYNSKSPYDRLPSSANDNDIITLILIRMMIFMGLTHSEELTDDAAISIIATAEATTIKNSKSLNSNALRAIKSAFENITATDISAIVKDPADITKYRSNTINGVQNTIIKPSATEVGYYTYDYIFPYPDGKRILPISDSFNGTWPTGLSGLVNKRKDDSSVFLTNYTRDVGVLKKDNGGRYIDIKYLPEYQKINGKTLSSAVGTPVNIVSLNDLQSGSKSAYSIFNGPYGMQEFKTMNYNEVGLESAPLMLLFYSEKIYKNVSAIDNDDKALLASNFVSFGRKPTSLVSAYIYPYDYPSNIAPRELGGGRPYPTNVKMLPNNYDQPIHSNTSNNNILNNRKMLTFDKNGLSYPYIELSIYHKPMSLFGSQLYYRQGSEHAKAFLFLNTLPFNGFPFPDNISDEGGELTNLFNKTGGFIHAPRLWCAWVGSLIWRAGLWTDSDNFGKSNTQWKDPIKYPTFKSSNNIGQIFVNDFYKPIGRFNYFRGALLHDRTFSSSIGNTEMSEFLKFLPQQVLDEFYYSFNSFVTLDTKGYTSWNKIRGKLELINIVDGKNVSIINSKGNTDYEATYNQFDSIIYNIYTKTYVNGILNNTYNPVPVSTITDFLINIDTYSIITPVESFSNALDSDYSNDALFLEIKGDYDTNDAIKNIIDALTEEVVIVNSGYGAWTSKAKNLPQTTPNTETLVNKQNILIKEEYLKTYLSSMKAVIATIIDDPAAPTVKNKQDIFGTDSDEIIKLQLYRTCKNVYDKWIGNATDGNNIIFQCGGVGTETRHTLDKELANKRTDNKDSTAKLIDSFRFVTRSFRDIGDDFYIDPRPISTYLTDNPNASFYGCVTDLLASNNFDFIALPSFINYNDKETMESMFDTYTFEEAVKDGICGPSFVCVYVGQKSKHLDFQGSDYTNDGFDIQCDSNGGMKQTLPKDFTNKSSDYENAVAVFKVGYSQQNQNIFKDITLDQSEFTETEESLKIIDDISKTGSENQRHFGGQNLYSVYGVRSYKAEVEMMGNAMIQPMMYFQLDNIPMFHGAYMITHVKHSIVPNSMSTNFTGVRIRHPETPILDAAELYMSLLQNIEVIPTAASPLATVGCPNIAAANISETQYGHKDNIMELLAGTFKCPNLDCNGSIAGLKQVPKFWDGTKLTKIGMFAIALGFVEGIGVNQSRRNPGNITSVKKIPGQSRFVTYPTWKKGWEEFYDKYITTWCFNGNVTPTTSATYANCYKDDVNQVLSNSGSKFQTLANYNYAQGQKPTLRQFVNIYNPWGDGHNNVGNYIAAIAITMKDFGYDIDVDVPMDTWLI